MQTAAMKANNRSRRSVLQVAALTVGAIGAASKAIGQIKSASVALVTDPNDPLVSSSPVAWALQELETALTQKRITAQRVRTVEDSSYLLQHYFKLKQGNKSAWLHPGLNADFTNQPYFVVRSV